MARRFWPGQDADFPLGTDSLGRDVAADIWKLPSGYFGRPVSPHIQNNRPPNTAFCTLSWPITCPLSTGCSIGTGSPSSTLSR